MDLYRCRIKAWELGKMAKKQTPYFRLVCEVIEPVETPVLQIEEGSTADIYLWLTPKAIRQTVEKLRAIGWNGKTIATLSPTADVDYGVEPHDFFGTEFIASVREEEYDGRVNMKWDISRTRASLSKNEMMELAKELDGVLDE